VLALAAWTGRDRVRLVGHDWGATIAWMFAARHPERVERLAILNGAHPRLLLRELEKPDQRRRSAYFAFFQLPCLPEWWVTRRAYLERVLRGKAVSADAFGDADIERYHDALRRPGAAKAAIDYYRAARRWPLDAGAVRCPTLVVWGERDHALGPGLLDGLQQVAPDPRIVRIAGASHWVQHDAPETGEPRADRAPPAVSHRA
jgi:pimeloyl-ACP methyl ester carboxylesterase